MRSGDVRVVGFDCAEERHAAVLLDAEGEVELELEVENAWEAIEGAFGRLLLRVPEGGVLRVAVESQRSHGRLVADCARSLSCALVEVDPTALNRFRKVEGLSSKTDSVDAFLLARIAFFGHGGARESVEYAPEERALQRMTDLHQEVTEEKIRALFRLRSLMLEVLPRLLKKDSGLPSLGSGAMLALLQRWPGFEGMERAHQNSIVAILRRSRCRGDVVAMARSLRGMAKEIRLPAVERRVVTASIRREVRRILECQRELAELEAQLAEALSKDPDGVRLMEMPGVGVKTAAVLLGWYRPVARCRTEAQAATYAGVTPVSRQSGKSAGRGHLSRRVNKKILRAVYLSAVASLKASSLDRAYYEKKKESYSGHPKPHTAAVIALARQRIKVMYRILVEGERYDKEKLIARHLERERSAAVA